MTHFDDDQIAAWLNEGPQHAGPGAVEDALRHAHAVPQRPGWLVAMTVGTLAENRPGSLMRFAVVAAAVALLTALLLGALVVGGVIKPLPAPSIVAIESESPQASGEPTPTPLPSTQPVTGAVAYTLTTSFEPGEGDCPERELFRCSSSKVMVARADGSNAHDLFPGATGGPRLIAWTPDGSRLLVDVNGELKLASLSGDIEPLTDASLCNYPCVPEIPIGPGAFSPDGDLLAFTRQYPDVDYGTVITILNLRTGKIRELASTYAIEPTGGEHCHELTTCQGTADAPSWSPDGKQLVFARQHMSPDGDAKWTSAALYVVDGDDSNLKRITPPGFFAIDPSWSPDGTRITFLNAPWGISRDGTHATDPTMDIYTVRPDGSDLQRLTTDGDSARPDWTSAGRIVFARNVETDTPDLWIMEADGSHQARILGNVLAELWAAGCQVCMFPLDTQSGGLADALWQPVR